MIKGIITQDGTVMSRDEVLSTALTKGSIDGFPPDILWTIMKSWKSDKPSASQLGRAARQNILENILDYYVTVDNRIPLFRGSVVHKGLEHATLPHTVPVMREVRLTSNMPMFKDIFLTGQIDIFYRKDKKLVDYKTCSKMPRYIRDYHLMQLAVYKWLLVWNGYDVEEVGITYIAWNYVQYVNEVKLSKGIIPAIDYWMINDEAAFQKKIAERYHLLHDGYHEPYIIPSMSDCNRRWCSNCPVKWACDRIPTEGTTITQKELDEFDHDDYV